MPLTGVTNDVGRRLDAGHRRQRLADPREHLQARSPARRRCARRSRLPTSTRDDSKPMSCEVRPTSVRTNSVEPNTSTNDSATCSATSA